MSSDKEQVKKFEQKFTELEYVFQKYYNEHFAPVVNQEQRKLQAHQEEELRAKLENIGTGKPVKNTSDVWSRKNTGDLINSIQVRLGKDEALCQDMEFMAEAWRALAVTRLGEENYAKLSEQSPSGDLAADFVKSRFEDMMMTQLAKSKVPKNSLDYIVSKGLSDTLVGSLVGLTENEKDKELQELAYKLYKPNAVEQASATLLAITTDTAITGPAGTAVALSRASLDLGGRVALTVIKDKFFEGKTIDQAAGEALFGDKAAFASQREKTGKFNPAKSELVDIMNQSLSHKLKVPEYRGSFDQTVVNQLYKELSSATDDGQQHLENIKKVMQSFSVKADVKKPVPQWMQAKSLEDSIRYSSRFLAIALEMKNSGRKEMDIQGKKLSYDEVLQRSYDYSRCAAVKQEALDAELQHSEDEDLARARAAQARRAAREPAYRTAPVARREYSQNASMQAQGQQHQQQQQQQLGQQSMRFAATSSWSGLMDSFGLSGMGEIGQNIGYVLATLPDMLVGMFTGETQSLKLRNNILPIASIFAGMFVKNPLLKLLLVGLGGANLLNKVGHESLEKGGAGHRPVLFREYPNEVLDPRIENPAIKGRSLLAYIDGVPNTILIDDATVSAYEQGKLPLNTLCNAVLRKYDEQFAAVNDNLNRELAEAEERGVVRGLK